MNVWLLFRRRGTRSSRCENQTQYMCTIHQLAFTHCTRELSHTSRMNAFKVGTKPATKLVDSRRRTVSALMVNACVPFIAHSDRIVLLYRSTVLYCTLYEYSTYFKEAARALHTSSYFLSTDAPSCAHNINRSAN